MLPNLEGYHKVEFFIELERLSQVGSEEAVGRDPQRALVDPGSIHPKTRGTPTRANAASQLARPHPTSTTELGATSSMSRGTTIG